MNKKHAKTKKIEAIKSLMIDKQMEIEISLAGCYLPRNPAIEALEDEIRNLQNDIETLYAAWEV